MGRQPPIPAGLVRVHLRRGQRHRLRVPLIIEYCLGRSRSYLSVIFRTIERGAGGMFIKRLVAVGAATLALAGAGITAAGPASATVETGRSCRVDWSKHWTICLVEQTDPDGSKWYHAHGWNDLHQWIIVELFDAAWQFLDAGNSNSPEYHPGWAATHRFQDGWNACIYDASQMVEFLCN